MKILIASRGKNRLSEMPERFGKAENFVIYETEADKYSSYENKYFESEHGAGVNNIKELLKKNIDILIVKKLGEKSAEILKYSNIKVYQGKGGYIYNEIEDFLKGNLEEIKLN